MNKAFVLPTSFILDDSNLIDNIRQTFLDLQTNADEQSVQRFLDEAFSYLCTDYQTEVAQELLPVISLCFSLYPQYSLPLADKFLKSSKLNEYLIISSASIVFELTNNKTQIDFPDYHSFIDDCLKEILPQIQNQNDTKLTIFDQEISYQYHNLLILDLLLSTKLTEELFSNFFSYIFNENLFLTNPKFDLLLSKLIEAGFIKILPLTDSSINNLQRIIEMQNFNAYLEKKNDETLFFMSQVVHFTRTEGKSGINDLTEEIILPFIALTTIYYRFPQFNFTFSEQKLTNLLLDSIKNLNDKSTKLNKESINFILKNLDEIKSNQLISKSTVAEIITILAKKLIHNEFIVDKIFFLSLLFGYFVKGSDELDPSVKQFIESEEKSLFDYIFNNLDEINNSIKLQKLNLSVFDKPLLIEYLNSKLKSERSVQTVYFLENFCLNVPKLAIPPEIFEKVEQNDCSNLLLIARFMKKNLGDEDFKKIKDTIPKNVQNSLSNEIPTKETNIDDILSCILANPHDNQEESSALFNLLFDKMTTDQEMLQNYLLYTIDYLCSSTNDIKSFLAYYIDQYEKYRSDFINAVNKRCNYISTTKEIEPEYHFKLNDLPIPESGIYVVDKLFNYANENKATYQLFLCMKNIACPFPFLFKNYSQQIFDLVLPNIDYLYLLFDQNANEKSKEMAKTAYSSLSFLYSTLKLPNILENFLNWMITNIFSFSNSQILGFLIILCNLYMSIDFDEIIAITVKNYNLLETLQIFFDREIEEGECFGNYYKLYISLTIAQILLIFTSLNSNEFERLESYYELDHPIIKFINNSLKRLPNIKIDLFSVKNEHFSKQIQDFIIDIDCQHEFWIIQDKDQISIKKPNEYQVYSFSNELYGIISPSHDPYEVLSTYYQSQTTQTISFNHIKSYCETLFRIATMESIDDRLYSKFKHAFAKTCSIRDSTAYVEFIISNIKEFDENNIGSDSSLSLRVMERIIDTLAIFAQYNKLTLSQAINVASIILSPKWRNNSTLVMKMVYLLRFYSSLPVSVLLVIEFDVLQSKIIGERDIATVSNICGFQNKQIIVNQYYKHYSDLGKKTAIAMYGILIKDGICLNADIPLALTYIKKAIEFEDPAAIAYYALMLQEGQGVDKNVDESIKLLQKAVDNGSDIAMNTYGVMLENGTNVEKNFDKAVFYYQKAADKYNMKAFYNLGIVASTDHEHIYYTDNVNLATSFLKKAADQGILDAIYKYGIENDIGYVEKAAKKGHLKAIKSYISYIINNEDEFILPENAEWLQKGIELGIKGAIFRFSSCLEINNMGNLAMNFNLLDYANDNVIEAMTDYHREQWKKKGFTGDSYKQFAEEADKYIDILKQYKKDNTKVFVDENFRPFKKWKRIDEIYDVPLFKRELIDSSFIIQGSIGDCCLISALSRAAKQFYLIPELFDYHSPNKILGVVENSMNIKCGAVVVNFHVFGRITPVLIDTLVPVTDEGIPLLSHPVDKTKSPWFCLVEKAFIKLNGSFLSIEGIPFEKALYCMYFTYSKIFRSSRIGTNIKVIDSSTNKQYSLTFDKLNEYYNSGCVIHAAITKRRISERSKEKGLIKSHSYHIYNLGSYKGMNFVCLRNPWGQGEWEGKYSRTSNSTPDDLKKFLDYEHLPSGAFWMSFDDFFKIYNRFVILKPIHPDWNIKMFPIQLQKHIFSDLQTFAIKIKQQIPEGEKCRLHFLVEKRLSFMNLSLGDDVGSNYKLVVASVNENEAHKIELSKIKDEKHFASFSSYGDVENYSFDVTDNNEVVYVTVYSPLKQKYDEYCYVNVMCKYNFDLYDVDHPEKLFSKVNNPGYVFENNAIDKSSKRLSVKSFDNKLEFSLNTANSIDYSGNEERDELIGKLFKYKKFDFKMWQVDINMYTKVQEKPLGGSTNGTVFLVKMKSNDELYAAKVLNKSVDLKFLRELSILRSLRYPSIINFKAFSSKDFEGKDHPTIITEYMKGGSLYDFIEKVHMGTCTWTSTDKMIILIGIAFGMDYLRNHEIMHRDLKLQNVLLDDDITPKISDFAESKNFQIELDNGQVEIVGTPLFMAPEIKNGSRYSFQIDVYSFGVIAYYIYTDQFPDESHPIDMNKLDSKFKKFISSMIDEDPEKRPTFEAITKMYLNNFEETWIDGADVEKVEIYLHQLGVTLKPREHHLDLEVIRSITPEVYPENAKSPIVDIDEILNNENIPETLSIPLINASVMLQSEGEDYAESTKEARTIYREAGRIFFTGYAKDDVLIQADPFYAIKFLREASLLKDRDSMYMLSQIFSESSSKDCQEIAFKVASMSADLGCPEAERTLGKFYLNGIGTEKNVVMAALYFKLAADKGDTESMYLFANTLIKNNIFTKQNEQQSAELNNQIEKTQQIVDQMKGMSNKVYKEFLLTKDAISNPVITAFVAKRYYENAARKGVEEANDALLSIDKSDAEIESDHNIPDFANDIVRASISVSIDFE